MNMTHSTRTPRVIEGLRKPVLVGYDGSDDSSAAVLWAAHHAAAAKLPLVVVHCWVWPYFTEKLGPVAGIEDSGLRRQAEKIVAEGHDLAVRFEPGLDVRESEARCCGLAGNFGVERGHYDVSVAVANNQLLQRRVTSLANEGYVVAESRGGGPAVGPLDELLRHVQLALDDPRRQHALGPEAHHQDEGDTEEEELGPEEAADELLARMLEYRRSRGAAATPGRAVAGAARSRRHTSSPSMSGSPRSRMTRSAPSVASFSRPMRAFSASIVR